MSTPYVKKDEKGINTLYVGDRPFFCRAGEIHNSSASDPEYMRQNVWPQLRGLHMNSVIVPVYWELIEAEEGHYDFSSVDSLVTDAGKEGLKLILLWFGLWKNAESMYVPSWMKQDTLTYFRAEKMGGERMTTISPLCVKAVEKDAQAFASLMKHIREIDEKESTVIVMQVENEIGLLGTDRDYSSAAQEAFSERIPEVLAELTGRTGSWGEAFGEDAGEAFMAWHFACAVERIASAGKKEYDLPCYVNAWLKQYPWYAGSYPSGGPVESVQSIWRCAAPSIFAFGPDIYVPYCADVMDSFASADNPLFVPEIRKDAVAASYVLYAFGGKNAICFSPFGIEELALDPSQIDRPPMEVMAALNIDPSAFDTTGSKEYLACAYRLLEELEPLYLKYRGSDRLKAFVKHGDTDYGTYLRFGSYNLTVAYAPKQTAEPLGAGIVIELEKDTFLITGTSCTISFQAKPGEPLKADILRLEEGTVVNGQWKRGRILNGDEKMSLKFGNMPEMKLVKLYRF
jgi:hypothetical protein